MKNMTMKGGDEHSIEAVLGENFMKHITQYEAGGMDPSYFKCSGMTSKPRDAQPDDVSPLFFQLFASAIREFNWMESPDATKPAFHTPDVRGKFEAVFKSYINDSGIPATAPFKSVQAICNLKNTKVKLLSEGLCLMNLDKEIPVQSSNYNYYEQIVIHLYKYISLLDLDSGVTGFDVVDALRDDTVYFMPIIQALSVELTDNKHGANKLDINSRDLANGLLKGFGAVANKIVSDLRDRRVANSLPNKTDIVTLANGAALNLNTVDAFGLEIESATASPFKYTGTTPVDGKTAEVAFVADLRKFVGALIPVAADPARDALYDNKERAAKQAIWNFWVTSKYTQGSYPLRDPSNMPTSAPGGASGITYNIPGWKDFIENTSTYHLASTATTAATVAAQLNARTALSSMTPVAAKADVINFANLGKYGINNTQRQALTNPAGDPWTVVAGTSLIPPTFMYSDKPLQGRATASENNNHLFPTQALATLPAVAALIADVGTAGYLQQLKAILDIIGDAAKEFDRKLPLRVFALGLIAALVEHQLKGNTNYTTTAADQQKIRNYIVSFINAYDKVYDRTQNLINTRDTLRNIMNSTRGEFIHSFSYALSGQIQYMGATKTFGAKSAQLQKKTISRYAKFYENWVKKEPRFYGKFFNLLKLVNGNWEWVENEPLESVKKANYDQYRLNVKKNIDLYSKLMLGQTGGADDDIYIISLVPKFGPESKTFWIDSITKISAADVKKYSTAADVKLAWEQIFRDVYLGGTDKFTIKIDGKDKEIDIGAISDLVATRGYPDVDLKQLFNARLKIKLSQGINPKMDQWWLDFDNKLRESDLRTRSKWQKEDGVYVFKGADGKDTDWVPDSCELTTMQGQECDRFYSACVASEASWPVACKEILTKAKDISNIPISEIAAQVSKINPAVALSILSKFNFRLVDAKENDPVRGLNIYKVQPVSEWIHDMVNDPNISNHFGSEAPEVLELIKKGNTDTNTKNFLNYLSVLVNWVNAHPEINNKELRTTKYSPNYPEADKSFKSFTYRSPYKSPKNKLYEIGCGLDRLKTSIYNKLLGSDAERTLSNITSTPLDLEMPLNRVAYTYQYPRSLKISGAMLGGGDEDNLNELLTHSILNDIYEDIKRNMTELGSSRVKGSSQAKIEEALDKIKKGEEAYRESIKSLIAKYRLYKASHGRIDPFNIEDNELPELLKKHSNLFHLSQALNKHSIRLVDVLRTLVKIVHEKEEDKSQGKKKDTYPIFGVSNPAPALPSARASTPAPAPVTVTISGRLNIRGGAPLSPNDSSHGFTLGGNWVSVQHYVQSKRVNHLTDVPDLEVQARAGTARQYVNDRIAANPAIAVANPDLKKATIDAYRAQLAAHADLQTALKASKGPITFDDENDRELGKNSLNVGDNLAGRVLQALRTELELEL